MKFVMTPLYAGTPKEFSETDAPDWLTSKNTVRGSTMDMRWFWEDHVLKLPVGGVVLTEFQKIQRTE